MVNYQIQILNWTVHSALHTTINMENGCFWKFPYPKVFSMQKSSDEQVTRIRFHGTLFCCTNRTTQTQTEWRCKIAEHTIIMSLQSNEAKKWRQIKDVYEPKCDKKKGTRECVFHVNWLCLRVCARVCVSEWMSGMSVFV